MPLPKPLKRNASKKTKKRVVKETLRDLKSGPHHKDRTHKQEVAIAMKESGQSRKKKASSKKPKASAAASARNAESKKNKAPTRRKRNKGRS